MWLVAGSACCCTRSACPSLLQASSWRTALRTRCALSLRRSLSTLGRPPSLVARERLNQPVPSPRNRERSGEQRNAATLEWRGRAGRLRTSHERREGPRHARGETMAFPTIGPHLPEEGLSCPQPHHLCHPHLASVQGTDAAAREPFRLTERTRTRGREFTNRRPLIYKNGAANAG
jgi:hypothetical protein